MGNFYIVSLLLPLSTLHTTPQLFRVRLENVTADYLVEIKDGQNISNYNHQEILEEHEKTSLIPGHISISEKNVLGVPKDENQKARKLRSKVLINSTKIVKENVMFPKPDIPIVENIVGSRKKFYEYDFEKT